MEGSKSFSDSIDLLYQRFHKISLNDGKSYIDSPRQLRNKQATRNRQTNNDKTFQCAIAVALNHKDIVKDPQRKLKINPFINQNNWKGIDFPSNKNY